MATSLKTLTQAILIALFLPMVALANEWIVGPEGELMKVVEVEDGEIIICSIQSKARSYSEVKERNLRTIHIRAHLADMAETELGYIRAEWWAEFGAGQYIDTKRRGGLTLNILCGDLPTSVTFNYYWPSDEYDRPYTTNERGAITITQN